MAIHVNSWSRPGFEFDDLLVNQLQCPTQVEATGPGSELFSLARKAVTD